MPNIKLKWYESSFSDESPIISSRVRLARNLRKYNFPPKLTRESALELINEVTSSIKNDSVAIAADFEKVNINLLSQIQVNALLENHIISPEFFNSTSEKAVLVSKDESVDIMINEEDHIRMQAIFPGNNIDSAYELINNIDNLIEETVEYAYDNDFGYLTACPTNTGTAMRSSFMVHIPALEMTNQLMNIVQSINKFGFTVRGIYGEGSKSAGSIYQISNQMTMGKPEIEINALLKNVTSQVIEQEKACRGKLLSDKAQSLEDRIYRAYGILSYAKAIDVKEAMSLLSDIRLGYNEGILKLKRPRRTVYSIMMSIQPGNIQKYAHKAMTDAEMNIVRADYIRNCLDTK